MTSAVFTLLYNTTYLAGALVLGSTIKRLIQQSTTQEQKQYKLGILIDKSKFSKYQLELLSTYYDDLIDVSPISSQISHKLIADLKRPDLDKTFTKILLWSLIDYEKILYLDADTLPLIPKSSSITNILDLLQLDFPNYKILAAPDSGFPDIFNSGVFMMKPNMDDYSNLSNLVKQSSSNPNVSFDGADQGLLNQYFNSQPDWISDLLKKDENKINSTFDFNSNWIKIPFLYNVTPSAAYEYLPAFRHFQPESFVPENYGIPAVDAEQPSHDGSELQSTFDTLSRYRSTALTHYNFESNQIKLLHFIGPYKPWTSTFNVEGIHKDWWAAWVEEFGEKSILDVLYPDEEEVKASMSLPRTPASTPATEAFKNYDDEEVEKIDEISDLNLHERLQLLNPSNYHQFKDSIKPSLDAMWDPTKEEPPKHKYVQEEKPDQLKDTNIFQNQWDQNIDHDEAVENDETPSFHMRSTEILPKEQPELYGHRYVKPERVFDANHDYTPTHILQELSKVDISKEKQDLTEDSRKEAENLAANVSNYNEYNEVLEKEGLIEESAFDEAYDEDAEDIDNNGLHSQDTGISEDEEQYPALFPWEFKKDGRTPERSFD